MIMISGCSIKNENNMSIDSSGKLNYQVLLAFDKELLTNVMTINEYPGEINNESMMDYINYNLKVPYLDGLVKKDYYEDNGYKILEFDDFDWSDWEGLNKA